MLVSRIDVLRNKLIYFSTHSSRDFFYVSLLSIFFCIHAVVVQCCCASFHNIVKELYVFTFEGTQGMKRQLVCGQTRKREMKMFLASFSKE